MNYIVVALKAEAQAFVEHLGLSKSRLGEFSLYTNATTKLIISGMGVANARAATQTLINHFDITPEDNFYNVGICGASTKHKIGEIIEIGTVVHEEKSYVFDANAAQIHCVCEAVSEEMYEIVDMESYGFYDAIIHNPAIEKFRIIKVVSDHFTPESITKDGAKNLVLKALKNPLF